jgi:hypothetical protein
VLNDVTEPARRQGGKQRREPFDRHHCSVRVVDCLQRDVDQLTHAEGRVLQQRALAAHEDCRNEALSEPLGNPCTSVRGFVRPPPGNRRVLDDVIADAGHQV